VLLKLRRAKCELDYLEVMACPSGCNNGGGQIKISSAPSISDGNGNAAGSGGGLGDPDPLAGRELPTQVPSV
jgi:hypothetical protein